MWHNPLEVFQTMALLVSPDTPLMKHLFTKFQQPRGIPCMWAPTPKNLNSHNQQKPTVILPDYLRMAQIPTAHNTSV